MQNNVCMSVYTSVYAVHERERDCKCVAVVVLLTRRRRLDNLEIRFVFVKKQHWDDLFYIQMLCQLHTLLTL